MVEIQAHRGNCEHHRENTLQAFASAWQAGADCIELDVHLTKDGYVVVCHDFTLPQDTESILGLQDSYGNRLIRDLTLLQIKDVALKGAGPMQPGGYFIPTLAEVIDCIMESKHPRAQTIELNIELKRDPRAPHLSSPPSLLIDEVLKVVKEKGFENRVQYSSFDPEVLSILKEKNAGARAIFLCDANTLSFIEKQFHRSPFEYVMHFASIINISTLALDHTLIDSKKTVALLKKKGFKVIAWTVNTKEDWQRMISYGVDSIITDRPTELIKYLQDNPQGFQNRIIRGIKAARP